MTLPHPNANPKPINRYRMIKFQYKSGTNHHGSRILITDCYLSMRKYIPYSYDERTEDAVINYLLSIGITTAGMSSTNGNVMDVILTEDFETPINRKPVLSKSSGPKGLPISQNSATYGDF